MSVPIVSDESTQSLAHPKRRLIMLRKIPVYRFRDSAFSQKKEYPLRENSMLYMTFIMLAL